MKLSVELGDTHWMLPRNAAKVICQENLNDSVSLSLSKAETAGRTLEFHVITLNTLDHSIFASLNFLIMKFSEFTVLYLWIKKLIICCVRNKLCRTRIPTTLLLRNIVYVGTKYGCWLARTALTLEWWHRRGGLLCVYSWQATNACQLKERWCGVRLCCASHNYYVVKVKIKVK